MKDNKRTNINDREEGSGGHEKLKSKKHKGDHGEAEHLSKTTWMLCVDGSKHCTRAFDWIKKTIDPKHDKLYIVHVIEKIHSSHPKLSHYIDKMESELNIQLHQHAESVIEDYQKLAAELRLQYETRIVTADSAKEAICDLVQEHEIDNLVLARRGLSDSERVLLGSTSDFCVQFAYANVIIVK